MDLEKLKTTFQFEKDIGHVDKIDNFFNYLLILDKNLKIYDKNLYMIKTFECYCFYVHNNKLFILNGCNVYKINKNLNSTKISTIPNLNILLSLCSNGYLIYKFADIEFYNYKNELIYTIINFYNKIFVYNNFIFTLYENEYKKYSLKTWERNK